MATRCKHFTAMVTQITHNEKCVVRDAHGIRSFDKDPIIKGYKLCCDDCGMSRTYSEKNLPQWAVKLWKAATTQTDV